MRLPHGDQAYVDPRKVSAYLLSLSHPVGRHKARYFLGLGFTPDDIELLRSGLQGIAAVGSVMGQVKTLFGTRYIVDGGLTAPNGATANLRTIWIVESGHAQPRFVTAFPRRRWRGAQ